MAVIPVQAGVSSHLRREDSVRLGVVAHHPDIEVVLVTKQGDLGSLARHSAGGRDSLHELPDLRRPIPGRLIQGAVDQDGLRYGRDHGRPNRLDRVVLLDRSPPRDRGDEPLQAKTCHQPVRGQVDRPQRGGSPPTHQGLDQARWPSTCSTRT